MCRIFSNLIRTLFYSFRGLKYQMRIIIACGLDSRPRAGFWKNYRAAVRAVRTVQYNTIINFIYYLLLQFIIMCLAYRRPTPQRQPHSAHEPYGPSFTGFKTTSRNVQRCGLLYRLLAK